MEFYLENTPSTILTKLKDCFKTIRRQQKISQEELAHRSGVSFGSIKRFETTGQISMDSFLKILNVLGKLEEMNKLLNSEEDFSKIERLFSTKSLK